jgi:agmatine/peptidylarginine deiminase
MLTWPHDGGDWAALLARVEPVFFAIAVQIARRECLFINCASAAQRDRLRASLVRAGVAQDRLFMAIVASNDSWARDHGPLTVFEQQRPRLLDFRFNGWGNRYPAQADDAITTHLAGDGHFGSTAVDRIELVLEGGSIDSDGAGTLLTTSRCLLHPQRNPGYGRETMAQKLAALLGAQRLLWLEHGGLQGDDTDGHIDMLARFCDATTLVYQSCDEAGYACYDELRAMAGELRRLRTAQGSPYRLLALPWPRAKFAADGTRLPASYANFLVINDAVLLPGYNDPADGEAVRRLQLGFPEREIIQIDCSPLIQQYGSLHCLTMQFPKGVEFSAPIPR